MRLIFFFLIAIFFGACNTAQRNIESGDFDDAIEIYVRKLRGKRKKQTEHIQALELAFRKATDRDLRLCEYLADPNRPENWEKINNIHRQMARRQTLIYPLLPLVGKDGYRATFQFVNIERLEQESREKAADYLYTRAEALLRQAEQGDKQSARTAYGVLLDLERRYFANYRQKDKLLNDARYLGTNHILFDVRNQSNQILPAHVERQVLNISAADLDGEWRRFYMERNPNVQYDYRVVFEVQRIDFSPERVAERSYCDEREVEDGWEYVLDARGNVMKDTSGNDIRQKRFARIRANVVEVCQTKAARLGGGIVVLDARGNRRLDYRDVATEIRFEHFAATFQGDARALTDQSRARIGSRPLPFPSNEDMLAEAAERLKPDIRSAIRSSRVLQ
jgi:hypothetical protein